MTIETNWWNVIDSKSHVKCAWSMIGNHLFTYRQSIHLESYDWSFTIRGCVKQKKDCQWDVLLLFNGIQASIPFMPDGSNHLEVYQFSVDVFDWSKTIFIQLKFCTYGEQQSDAAFLNYF